MSVWLQALAALLTEKDPQVPM